MHHCWQTAGILLLRSRYTVVTLFMRVSVCECVCVCVLVDRGPVQEVEVVQRAFIRGVDEEVVCEPASRHRGVILYVTRVFQECYKSVTRVLS
jgi:hypothetical protein